MQRSHARTVLVRAYDAAVAAAQPARSVPRFLPPAPVGRLLVVGAGKAAAGMLAAVTVHYGGRQEMEGVVIVPYGTRAPSVKGPVRVREAAHPLPDEAGVAATHEILSLLRTAGAGDLVLLLLSGGGSALLTSPLGVTLEAKRELPRALRRTGAAIDEIDTVRRQLSAVKGGRLGLAAAPAPLHALVLSDVVGDDLASIASGPADGDPSGTDGALAVLDRHLPESLVRDVLRRKQAEGDVNPAPGSPRLAHVRHHLVGNNLASLQAARDSLRNDGYRTRLLGDGITGDARAAAREHARLVHESLPDADAPLALLSGGETTVQVKEGSGQGGRNSTFALALALHLKEVLPREQLARVAILAVDTDGIDGNSPAAGGLLDGEALLALDTRRARAALERNDSHGYLTSIGGTLVTGPTGTNVNDLRGSPMDGRGRQQRR